VVKSRSGAICKRSGVVSYLERVRREESEGAHEAKRLPLWKTT